MSWHYMGGIISPQLLVDDALHGILHLLLCADHLLHSSDAVSAHSIRLHDAGKCHELRHDRLSKRVCA